MSCKALIVTCMDPRLRGKNEIKIAKAVGLVPGEYELLTYPGPSLWLTNPHEPSHTAVLWWIIENVSKSVHHISEIKLIDHGTCGGFALKGTPQEKVNERKAIEVAAGKAVEIIRQRCPEMSSVKAYFVTIKRRRFLWLARLLGTKLPPIDIEPVQ